MKLTSSRFWLAVFTMGLSISSLLVFAGIWKYGRYYVQEPNLPIRIFETVGLVGIMIFGFVQYVKSIRD